MSDDITKAQKALNVIEKRPGIRSDELAKAAGIEQKQLSAILKTAIDKQFVVTAKISRPGQPDTTEWRLSQAVARASDWAAWKAGERTGSSAKPLKAEAPVRRQPAIEQRAVEIAADRHNTAHALQSELAEIKTQLEQTQRSLAIASAALSAAERDRDTLKQAATATTPPPIGYLVRAPKRKPRVFSKLGRAREAAESASRQLGRADVLALVPTGIARGRKAVKVEWQEA